MTGIGSITPTAYGSVTEPVKLRLTLPSANAKEARDHGLISSIGLPGGRGTMMANGMDPLRHVVDSTVLRTGLLAPRTAPTATPTGSQATATLDVDNSVDGLYNPSDQERIYLYYFIEFNTVLPPNPVYPRILIGSTGADTMSNLNDYLTNASGTKGVTWEAPASMIFPADSFTITKPNNYQITLTYNYYGAAGNNFKAYLYSGTWTDSSLGSTGATVGTIGYFTGGADGTGSAPSQGAYRYRSGFFRSLDGAISGYGTQVEAYNGQAQEIGLTSLPQPLEDDDIDFVRWYRTQNDGSKFYHGQDVSDGTTSDQDDITNTLLATHATYASVPHRTYESGMIHRVRYLAEHKGRWVGGGVVRASKYDKGTVTLTNGSTAAVITSGHPTKEMEHWTFRTNQSTEDDAREHQVVYVDEDTYTIYFALPWEGASTSSTPVSYELEDTRDPFRIHYSEPVLPNQTDATMELDGVQGPDPEGITGLYSAFESVVVFTRTGLWRMTGTEPVNFRVTHEYEGVGCMSHHSVILIDGALYWLAADGIYGWSGSGEPFKISNPPTGQGGEPRGISRTINRINWQHADSAFAHYDPETRQARWFLPLDGAVENTHALVFDFQTSAWSLDRVPPITYAQTVPDGQGNLRTLAGDVFGNFWELDVSTSDGAYGFEPRNTVAAGATRRSFSVDTANLPTSGSGLSGAMGYIVDSGGDFTPFVVDSNTASVVTAAFPLDTAPSDGDYVIFGGIHLHIESGRFSYDDKALRKIWEAVKVLFAYQSQGEIFVSESVNQGDPVVIDETNDLTATDGELHFWVRDEGRRLKVRIDAISPGFDVELQGIRTWIRIEEMADG